MLYQPAFQAATRALGLGHFDQAEGLFRAIPAGTPEHADAVMWLAVIAYQHGRFPEAVGHFSKLVAMRPGDAANHANLGECLREAGRLNDALVQLNLGLAIDPNQPDALNSLGLAQHARGRLDLAEDALRRAIRLRPRFATAMINLGMVLQERRRLREAAELFRNALDIEPENPMGNSNLGQILLEIGRIDDLDEAERCCLKAVRLTPDRPHPINNLGNVYRSMSRFDEAVECYRKAIAIAPRLAMPLNNMAQALQGRARYAEAADYYVNALALEPNSPRFHANYASLLGEQDRHDDALERYRHALAIDPDHAESHHGIGQVLLQLEKTEEAETCFRGALEIDPELTAPRLGLINLYSELGESEKAEAEVAIVQESHPKLVELHYQKVMQRKGDVPDVDFQAMTALVDEKYLGVGARSQLHFALGSVHDRRKNHREAALNFQAANDFQIAARLRRDETYDASSFTEWIDNIIEGFSTGLLERLARSGHGSSRPIFVVGLPRSGTTLTEQILASHPDVHGAGELTFINKTFQNLPDQIGLNGSDLFVALQSADSYGLKTSAEAYLTEVRSRGGDARFVVDKMPDNVNLLGWIRLMFPHAKIIHCRRDLRDVALSCWQTCFGSIRWANDLEQIARRFADYLRVVEHWRNAGRIDWLDFRYESVVEDTERYARDLTAYVGLDWHPNCLKFHETKRQIRTASLSQVREPIYRTSIAKWRHYERELAPFLDEMARHGHAFADTL